MKKLHIDFETRSTVDIRKSGGWNYAGDPSTEIMCLAYSLDGGPVGLLTLTDLNMGKTFWTEIPGLGNDFQIVAHNAHFEFAIYQLILVEKMGWPAILDPDRWDCTLARAAVCNLPLSLDQCGVALGISHTKDLTGRNAMLKLCKPVSYNDDGDHEPRYNEDPELYRVLYEYCKKDVLAEMEIDSRLPQMTPDEKKVWNLDLIMNYRGVRLDVPLARKAAALVGGITDELNRRLEELTGGKVVKASRIEEIKRYLKANGVDGIDSLDKTAVAELLKREDLDPVLRVVLDTRRQVGKTSTSKYLSIINVASPKDQRGRGLLQYHGASTGRWAGRLIQPHNFPKGVKPADQKAIITDIEECPDGEVFSLIHGGFAMDALSNALRGTIIAGPEKELVVADYNAIEPRVLFWLAGEESALASYRAGGSPYLDMGEFIYKKKITKEGTPHEYAVAKMTILGAGYGMGAPRFQAQCASAQPHPVIIPLDMANKAIRAYREKYKLVVRMWYGVEAAALKAIKNPLEVVACCGGKVHFGMDKKREFLCCRLPSGRLIRYYKPSVKGGEYGEEMHYMAPGGTGLRDEGVYGAMLVENITQAIARDLMANGMLLCEAAGYELVLTVHDELVAERSKRLGIMEEFMRLMCSPPQWGAGCPLAAEGWVGQRYRK